MVSNVFVLSSLTPVTPDKTVFGTTNPTPMARQTSRLYAKSSLLLSYKSDIPLLLCPIQYFNSESGQRVCRRCVLRYLRKA